MGLGRWVQWCRGRDLSRLALLVPLVGVGLVAPSVGTAMADQTCDGLPATILGAGVIEGTDGPDVIVGSDGPDTIVGLDGADTICAGDGDDWIAGGLGSDTTPGAVGDVILPGLGDDVVFADVEVSSGSADDLDVDVLAFEDATAGVEVDLEANTSLGQGTDTVVGFAGARGTGHDDTIVGNARRNEILGLGGDDYLDGRTGNDMIRGGPGDDRIVGQEDRDELFGGPGDDVLSGMGGDDRLDGGSNEFGPDDNDVCAQGRGSGPAIDCESAQLPIYVEDTTVIEGEVAAFFVWMPVPTDFSIRIRGRFPEGTASGDFPADYDAIAQTYVIQPGTVSTSISVRTIRDLETETHETFDVRLSNPLGETFLADPVATATIVDSTGPRGPR